MSHDLSCDMVAWAVTYVPSSVPLVLQVVLYSPVPGEFVGVLSALTGEPSFTSAKTTQHSHLIMISKPHLYQ